MQVGAVWRFPVKSMQGERLAASLLTGAGLPGDRTWAVRDRATGAVLSAKREPRLLLAAARAQGEGVVVDLPGHPPHAGLDGAGRLLSSWLGRPVTLDTAQAGPFVDDAPVHLVAAGELGDWDPRRFRANLVVAGVDDFDGLLGCRLEVGSAVVEVTGRTKRCAMTTAAQPGLAKDVGVLRTLAGGRDLRLGVYARVVRPGQVYEGASVRVM